MRAITDITIQDNSTHITMFLTYNNNSDDFGFTIHESVEEALGSLPVNDVYFPVRTEHYKLKVHGKKDQVLKLKRD